jgi:hypothetical protein
MAEQKPQGYDEAVKAYAANVSPRFLRLEGLEKWTTGRQYDGLPDWWTGGAAECPRWERRPCIVYPVTHVAISSNVDLVLGDGRFPTLTSKPGEDEQGEEGGLGEDDSVKLDRLIVEHHKLSRFTAHAREAFFAAQGCGTAIGLHGHRSGRPFAELVPAKWGNPKFSPDRTEVIELDIRYPYLQELKVDGKWTVKAKLFRRLITAERDTTFFPADAREDGTEPSWSPDPAQDITHNLGFCPVVWYPFMRGCAPVNQIDGNAIHANYRDEIHQLDLALSTKQTCMLNSEPQPVEIGVDPSHNPTAEMGRVAIVPSTERGGTDGLGDPGAPTGGYVYGQATPPARKRGAGFVWRYSDPETKVEYLAFPAGLLKEQEEHCNDLLAKIEDALAVVLPKPSSFKFAGAVSGRSMQETKARQYDRCDQYRDDFEQGFLLPSVNMQLRIAQRVGEALKVPGLKAAQGILDGFNVEEPKGSDDVAAA